MFWNWIVWINRFPINSTIECDIEYEKRFSVQFWILFTRDIDNLYRSIAHYIGLLFIPILFISENHVSLNK